MAEKETLIANLTAELEAAKSLSSVKEEDEGSSQQDTGEKQAELNALKAELEKAKAEAEV